MIGVGIFGKIESYAEFISFGTSSKAGQSFERWAEMANDQVARSGGELPAGPLGFCYRDEGGESVLLGVLGGSRDKVGRRFPLCLFCEIEPQPPVSLAGLVEELRPFLTQLSMLAATASEADPASLKTAIGGLELPDPDALRRGLKQRHEALGQIQLDRLLERIYPEGKNAAYGMSVLLRACDRALHDGVKRPITIDATVTSDVELSFWMACAERRLAGRVGPASAFWDVQNQRALIVPGVPDSNSLVMLSSRSAQNSKLWKTSTSSASAQTSARDQLGDDICARLDDASNCSVLEFIDALAPPA